MMTTKIIAAIVAALGLGFTGTYFATSGGNCNGGCPLSNLINGTPTSTASDCNPDGSCCPNGPCCSTSDVKATGKTGCCDGGCCDGEKVAAKKPGCCDEQKVSTKAPGCCPDGPCCPNGDCCPKSEKK